MATETIYKGDRVNLKIPQGETFRLTFALKDEAGNPVNLTGYTARSQFRESVTDPDVLYEGTTENAHIIIDVGGTVSYRIPAATTAAWTFRNAVYDLEVISPAGEVTRLTYGRVKVTPEVTR